MHTRQNSCLHVGCLAVASSHACSILYQNSLNQASCPHPSRHQAANQGEASCQKGQSEAHTQPRPKSSRNRSKRGLRRKVTKSNVVTQLKNAKDKLLGAHAGTTQVSDYELEALNNNAEFFDRYVRLDRNDLEKAKCCLPSWRIRHATPTCRKFGRLSPKQKRRMERTRAEVAAQENYITYSTYCIFHICSYNISSTLHIYIYIYSKHTGIYIYIYIRVMLHFMCVCIYVYVYIYIHTRVYIYIYSA